MLQSGHFERHCACSSALHCCTLPASSSSIAEGSSAQQQASSKRGTNNERKRSIGDTSNPTTSTPSSGGRRSSAPNASLGSLPVLNGDSYPDSQCTCDHLGQPRPGYLRQQSSPSLLTPHYSLHGDHMYQRMTEMVNQLEVREVSRISGGCGIDHCEIWHKLMVTWDWRKIRELQEESVTEKEE